MNHWDKNLSMNSTAGMYRGISFIRNHHPLNPERHTLNSETNQHGRYVAAGWASVDHRDRDGRTPLHAVTHTPHPAPHTPVLRPLYDPLATLYCDPFATLYAARSSYTSVAPLFPLGSFSPFAVAWASVDHRDRDGRTPLHAFTPEPFNVKRETRNIERSD